MIVLDKLYNQIEVSDPIVEQLIHTKPFLRLKEINQYGGVNFVYPDKYQVSRYEHSLGVYHVLKTIGADIEVQIAGLLHDIGHTAFSHMYDLALATHTEDNHEQIVHKLEGWDEVASILEGNNLKILKPDDYVLIKKSLPDIGADRFDYAIRDYFFTTSSFSDLPGILLKNLSTDTQGLYFNSLNLAKQFAENGNKAMWYVIYEPSVAVVYQSLIEMIKMGLNESWLTEADFLRTDKYVLNKMMQHKNSMPDKNIKIFTQRFTVEESDKENCDFKFVKQKSRYFDPRVKTNKGIKRVSELDPEFKIELEQYIKLFDRAKSGIYYKVIFA